MLSNRNSWIDRRSLLFGGASLAVAFAMPRVSGSTANPIKEFKLTAAPAGVPLVGAPHPETEVWCYNAMVPGPEIRVRQGDRVRIAVENKLPEETTVHWHGVRVPNAMDGVPHLTQAPIAPGETFVYEFNCLDAGTFWYHPHSRSFAQVGRGLAGAMIVEEREPIEADRDVTWVLGDWRMLKDASIRDDFGAMHDVAHAGRIGNTITVNGRVVESFAVRAGERVRLRLVNVANARIFGLQFREHEPTIIALDGQPVEPHAPPGGRIVLGPAMRVDLLLDLAATPGTQHPAVDTYYRNNEYRLLDLVYSDQPPLGVVRRGPSGKLAANPLPEPDLQQAERHDITLGGGAMSRMTHAIMDGQKVDVTTLIHNGLAWTINGIAARGHVHEPLLTFTRNRTYVLNIVNETMWPHPMHLHGHSFRVISRNGTHTRHSEWQDTVLIERRERAEIALVADNPGDWMFHCHVLEHMLGGMMGVIRVA